MTFPPELAWSRYRFEMTKHLEQDPGGWRFPWRWSTVVATMYVGPGRILAGEVEEMRQAGMTLPGWQDEDVTNLIHQRYHLWQWERNHPGMRLADLACIVEFGSGYGAMAIVAQRLGFNGVYRIIDFPEMLSVSLPHIQSRAKGLKVEVGLSERPDLLMSLFGLSEAPFEVRDDFISRIAPSTYLFGMQGKWGDIENLSWFETWAQGYFEHGGPVWHIAHEKHDTIYLTSTFPGRR